MLGVRNTRRRRSDGDINVCKVAGHLKAEELGQGNIIIRSLRGQSAVMAVRMN
jgi:hypothetical protein